MTASRAAAIPIRLSTLDPSTCTLSLQFPGPSESAISSLARRAKLVRWRQFRP